MICQTCKEAAQLSEDVDLETAKELHAKCKGGTFCDCQHKPTTAQENGSRAQRRA